MVKRNACIETGWGLDSHHIFWENGLQLQPDGGY